MPGPRPPLPFAAAITAGGQSRRFGQDKALYRVDGVPMLERVAASLQACAPRLLIAPPGRYDLPGWTVTPDLRPGLGPLAGLEAALTALPQGAEWVAYSAVDLPYLTARYWALLHAAVTPGAQAVVGRDEEGRGQPLAALYHRSALGAVQAHLDRQDLRMRSLMDALQVQAVTWPQVRDAAPLAFTNLNRPPA